MTQTASGSAARRPASVAAATAPGKAGSASTGIISMNGSAAYRWSVPNSLIWARVISAPIRSYSGSAGSRTQVSNPCQSRRPAPAADDAISRGTCPVKAGSTGVMPKARSRSRMRAPSSRRRSIQDAGSGPAKPSRQPMNWNGR